MSQINGGAVVFGVIVILIMTIIFYRMIIRPITDGLILRNNQVFKDAMTWYIKEHLQDHISRAIKGLAQNKLNKLTEETLKQERVFDIMLEHAVSTLLAKNNDVVVEEEERFSSFGTQWEKGEIARIKKSKISDDSLLMGTLREIVNGEKFIDEVVARIQRKQVKAGDI